MRRVRGLARATAWSEDDVMRVKVSSWGLGLVLLLGLLGLGDFLLGGLLAGLGDIFIEGVVSLELGRESTWRWRTITWKRSKSFNRARVRSIVSFLAHLVSAHFLARSNFTISFLETLDCLVLQGVCLHPSRHLEHKVGEHQPADADELSSHSQSRPIDQDLPLRESEYSVGVEDVHDHADLPMLRPVVDVRHSSCLHKPSEPLPIPTPFSPLVSFRYI